MVLDLRLTKIGCRDDNLFFFNNLPPLQNIRTTKILLILKQRKTTTFYQNINTQKTFIQNPVGFKDQR